MNTPRRYLAPEEVHVWAIPTHDAPLSEEVLRPLLALEEVERAGRFLHEADRTRFVLGRGLVRVLLGDYLGEAPAAVALVAGVYGKPELVHREGDRNLEFNVAHSGGWVLIGVARGLAVGIDIERVRDFPGLGEIASRWFAGGEAKELQGLPSRERVPAFFALWTLKEACHKALGVGLHAPLDRFRFPAAPNVEAASTSEESMSGVPKSAMPTSEVPMSEVPGVRHDGEPWSVWSLAVEEGYAAAVAVDRPGVRPVVRYWTGSRGGKEGRT